MDPVRFFHAAGGIVAPLLYRHTVVALRRRGERRYEVVSGILVSVDRRWFIATAAHTFPDAPNTGDYCVLTDHPQNLDTDGFLSFVQSNKDRSLDVGYLEVNLDVAEPFLGKEPWGSIGSEELVECLPGFPLGLAEFKLLAAVVRVVAAVRRLLPDSGRAGHESMSFRR